MLTFWNIIENECTKAQPKPVYTQVAKQTNFGPLLKTSAQQNQ
jgi:hypothetical protein